MGKLFISYRRDDTQDITGRVYDRLAARFGKDNIFMDVDSIPLGADFRKILTDAVASSDVALIMIGKQWLTVADGRGARRLDNPSDFVRIEVEAALARNIPVVPILTQGAPMPGGRDLPPSMKDLAYRHGMEVRSGLPFSGDVELLIARLTPLMSVTPVTPTPPPQPAAPRYPLPDIPARLASFGFRGVNSSGTSAIVPPLITIPAGAFLMGSDKAKDSQAYDDELPQHRVEVAVFQIGKYPVTVVEYALAVAAGAVREPPESLGVIWQKQQKHPDHPVVCVSWQDAVKYITWLVGATGQRGWRLLSEAEWEEAARWDPRTNTSRIYPWGDSFDKDRCNSWESDIKTTTPVGSYPASDPRRSGVSPFGVEDMAGNVWEWTSSLYQPYPYTQNDRHEDQKSIENRTLRGGSWGYFAGDARATFRNFVRSDVVGSDLGFRLAFSPAGS